jgi:hypothetical protein
MRQEVRSAGLLPDREGRAHQHGPGQDLARVARAPLFEPRHPLAHRGDDERHQADESHQRGAGLVDEIDCPPAVCADPGLRHSIVEKRIRDSEVEIARGDCGNRKDSSGDPGAASGYPQCGGRLCCVIRRVHDQKLRFV